MAVGKVMTLSHLAEGQVSIKPNSWVMRNYKPCELSTGWPSPQGHALCKVGPPYYRRGFNRVCLDGVTLV